MDRLRLLKGVEERASPKVFEEGRVFIKSSLGRNRYVAKRFD